ncbi:MAG: hypothetical protein Q9218_003144 [Villophora microphyllina]
MPPNTSTSTIPASTKLASPLAGPVCAGDSPLSTTANILSILTFALGLFASYVALISATHGAPLEIKRLVEDLRATQREINRVAEYIFDDMHNHPTSDIASLAPHANPLAWQEVIAGVTIAQNSWNTTAKSKIPSIARHRANSTADRSQFFTPSSILYNEVEALLQTCVKLFYEADDLLKRSERDPYGLRRRILFVMNRNELTEKMQRLADQKAKLAAVQMSLFLKQIAAFVGETRTGEIPEHIRQQSRSSQRSEDESG